MYLYNFIIENKELFKIIYALIIGLICAIIVIKSHRLFHLSLHKGIRYFRNAFFFYGIAFIIRYFFGTGFLYDYTGLNYQIAVGILFEYFLIMAGFFLLYSLLWKKIESSESEYLTSLFNSKIIVFYAMTAVIVFLDYIWQTYYFMFFSQIVLFAFASVLSYINYKKNGKQHKFLKFYFIAMILNLIAWSLNALAALYFNWHHGFLINIYILNIIIFLLFLYGVIKVTNI